MLDISPLLSTMAPPGGCRNVAIIADDAEEEGRVVKRDFAARYACRDLHVIQSEDSELGPATKRLRPSDPEDHGKRRRKENLVRAVRRAVREKLYVYTLALLFRNVMN